MAVSAGDKVPSVNFKMLTADGLSDVASDDYFGGKKTALFAVPGAFTPTCSAKHVPSFLAQGRCAQGQGRRPDRLRVGQRRVRDEGLGRGHGQRRYHRHAGGRQR